MGRLRGRIVPSWWLESCLGGISYRFRLADHFHLFGSEFIYGMSQGPPMCAYSSLSQDGFQRSLWVADITHYEVTTPPPLLTSKEPFCACVVGEVFLTLRMRNMWPFISYLDRAQLPPSSCYYGVSVHRGETVQSGAHLSPASQSVCVFTKEVTWISSHLINNQRYVCGLWNLDFATIVPLT